MAAFDLWTTSQIQRVLLTNVRSTGRSFGPSRSAVEMEMGGTAMTCVGKEIRDTSLAIFLEEIKLKKEKRNYVVLCSISDIRTLFST